MIQAFYEFITTLSTTETIFGVITLGLSLIYWDSPINRITVLSNKIFGDGTYSIDGQSSFGLVLEIFWYANIYYFVSEFLEFASWY